MSHTNVQEYNFSIYQGESVNLRFALTSADGQPTNLSGYSIRGIVKHRYGDVSGILDLNPVIVSGGLTPDPIVSGLIDINISAGTTSNLPVGRMIYDVEKSPINNTDATVKIIKGYFNILPEVTR